MKSKILVSTIISVLLTLAWFADTHAAESKLTASDGEVYDNFGISVSISGDYAIVGAYGDDDDQGSAYIFKRDGTWIQQQKLTASDGAVDDRFGYSVSISGDYAIVGAYGDDGDQGSVYIFKRDGTNWTEQAKLTASDGVGGDWFGRSVSISGDYAIVGAESDRIDTKSGQGSAYIFKRDGTWIQQQKLTASDGASYDYFGRSVSISGDYAMVGAYSDDIDVEDDQGSAYIFKRDGTWIEQTKLTASDGEVYDNFGISVSISGDYAIGGAYRDDIDVEDDQGSAYSFLRSGSSWSEKKKQIASDGTAEDRFSCSVSISGDYAIVGAYQDDDNGYNSGSAYIYHSIEDLSLPVKLSAFTAASSGNDVILKWRTETEVNNFGFAIYRSEEKYGNYHKIGFVSGAGNSARHIDYQFTDENVEQGRTYFYHLEDIDIAGRKSKSKIIEVVVLPAKTTQPISKKFRLWQNFPNPLNPETWIPYQLTADTPVSISIYNVYGQLVRHLELGKQKAGSYVTKAKAAYWDGKDKCGQLVSSGLYFYRLQAGEFSATKKMIIIK